MSFNSAVVKGTSNVRCSGNRKSQALAKLASARTADSNSMLPWHSRLSFAATDGHSTAGLCAKQAVEFSSIPSSSKYSLSKAKKRNDFLWRNGPHGPGTDELTQISPIDWCLQMGLTPCFGYLSRSSGGEDVCRNNPVWSIWCDRPWLAGGSAARMGG